MKLNLFIALSLIAVYFWLRPIKPSPKLATPLVVETAPPLPKMEQAPTESPQVISPLTSQTIVSQDIQSEPQKDLQSEWNSHVLRHLQSLEPARAAIIYQSYLEEEAIYQQGVEKTLLASLKQLSRLNGESDTEQIVDDKSALKLHEENIKEILGPHYGYIARERKEFFGAYQSIRVKNEQVE